MTCATSQGWGGASCAVVDRGCTKLMSVPSPKPARMVSLYASTHSTALNGATTADTWKAWTPPDAVDGVLVDMNTATDHYVASFITRLMYLRALPRGCTPRLPRSNPRSQSKKQRVQCVDPHHQPHGRHQHQHARTQHILFDTPMCSYADNHCNCCTFNDGPVKRGTYVTASCRNAIICAVHTGVLLCRCAGGCAGVSR